MRTLMILLCALFASSAKAEYYCMIFSSDSQPPTPRRSHVWATFVSVSDGRVSEGFTISWCPTEKWRLFKGELTGYNETLKGSIESALSDERKVTMWGPFAMNEKYFRNAKLRYRSLEQGEYNYTALDSTVRFDPEKPAVNCIHAVSDIAGVMRTGGKYGARAADQIVEYFMEQGIIENVPLDGNLIKLFGVEKYQLFRE